MYIEFRLPSGAGGMAAQYASSVIKKEIKDWAELHSVDYKTKIVKYTLRLCLNSPQEYTHFRLSWNPNHRLANNFDLIEPMNS
jgi:hypothetical protein